ncbi:YihY/virulence factor BrkB family protein [Microbacterium sp. LRZ72]|uniref:YihY/virulence factor BrkB family protein n=1 Tax=Microbacterium sp. LRZ72 TaxID=2942481 RepID=UPI0029A6C88E|nr:YihY/virulence factor BrkB family protein [Microbacterium sp. LRZ72]MDX2377141.1 YihY/virulence factor BrkB family protein [Microbacterium sp. LRZ72]
MAQTPASGTPIQRAIAWALARKPVRAFLLYSEQRGPMLADSITYRMLFAVFAAVLLGFSIAALWLEGNPEAWQALISAVDAAIPGLVGEDNLIDPSSIAAPTGLSITGIASSLGLIGASIGSVSQVRAALRSLADLPNRDIFVVWALLRNLALAVGVGVALLLAAAATFFGSALIDVVRSWVGLPDGGPTVTAGTWLFSAAVVFMLDAAIIATMFVVLSGVKASRHALWPGVLLGAFGLTVLQQLSGLFVGGARSNPLLASFAALIALLLWFNLSSQVVLISAAYILTGVEEDQDRVRARYGASTFAQRRVRRAERAVRLDSEELRRAREDEEAEREKAAEAEREKAAEDASDDDGGSSERSPAREGAKA